MLGIFRKNVFINSILMLPFIILLRLNTFLSPKTYVPNQEDTNAITQYIFSFLDNGITQSILASVLIFIQAVLVNRIIIINRLALKSTLFAGIIYATLASLFPSYSLLSEHLIANTFLILSIANVMKTFNKNYESGKFLNSGIYIGLAIMLVPEYAVLGFYGIAAAILFTSNLKNILQYISGMIVVVILFFAINFLTDLDYYKSIHNYIPNININFFTKDVLFSKEIIMLLIGTLYVLTCYPVMKLKKSVAARNKIESLYILFGLSSFVMLLYPTLKESQLLIPLIPISIFTGIQWTRIRNKVFVEVAYLAILALLIYFNFN